MVNLIPSILTNNLEEAKTLIEKVEGKVERVQIDVVDGIFADNKTFDPGLLASIETTLLLDFHLMVKNPVNWIDKCVAVGADRIIGQIEMMDDQIEFVNKVQANNLQAGLAINLATPVTSLNYGVWELVDTILIMSVPAGFGGQEFDAGVLAKFSELSKIKSEKSLDFSICDDGGVTFENIDDVHVLGVDEVVIGRSLFEGDIESNLVKYQKAAHSLGS